jgi:hypothetical protein
MQSQSANYGGHKLAPSIAGIDLRPIVESMIRDGIARRNKVGRYSRSTLAPAMKGFLHELTLYIAGIRDYEQVGRGVGCG